MGYLLFPYSNLTPNPALSGPRAARRHPGAAGPAPDPLPVSPPAVSAVPGRSAGRPASVRPRPLGRGPHPPRAPSHRFTGRLTRFGRARFTANGRRAASASPQRLTDGFSTR